MERIRLDPHGDWTGAAERAAAILRAGGIAILPAEGVYGLHALAAVAAAVERLSALKPREAGKRFIGLLAHPGDLEIWAKPDPRASELARAHWPGALTLVVEASPGVPVSLRSPEGTVALRCPGSSFLRAVVERAGGLVISTSANAPGEPALVHPESPLAERVELVVDQGELSGVPSTVVEIAKDGIRVLREGAVRVAGGPS